MQKNRLIAQYESSEQNDILVICTAGLHGNEPAGLKSLEALCKDLADRQAPCRGKIVALKGNLKALAAGKRFIDTDLNRLWRPSLPQELQEQQGIARAAEYEEAAQLLAYIEQLCPQKYARKIFIDLHTTSAKNGVFIVTPQPDALKGLLGQLPAPIVIGLEDKLQHTLMQFMFEKGFTSLVFEGGQHDEEASVKNMTYLLWRTLLETGFTEEASMPDPVRAYQHLYQRMEGLPACMSFSYLHKIAPGDAFEMLPGFENFQPVEQGQVLAKDRHGEIRAKEKGFLLMPLYQAKGEEGFFIVKESDCY